MCRFESHSRQLSVYFIPSLFCFSSVLPCLFPHVLQSTCIYKRSHAVVLYASRFCAQIWTNTFKHHSNRVFSLPLQAVNQQLGVSHDDPRNIEYTLSNCTCTCEVAWVRIPPKAAHFYLEKRLPWVCCVALLFV